MGALLQVKAGITRLRGASWDSTPDNSDDSDYIFDADDHSDDTDGGLDDALPRQHRQYEVVGEYNTYEAVLRALGTRNGNIYTYEIRYETNRRHARVYRCRSHVACDHRLKIISLAIPTIDRIYQLTVGGVHSLLSRTPVVEGLIHASAMKSTACSAWGGRLRSLLLRRYSCDPVMLAVIPSARQLGNLKAYLMRNSLGVWDLVDNATFTAWACTDW